MARLAQSWGVVATVAAAVGLFAVPVFAAGGSHGQAGQHGAPSNPAPYSTGKATAALHASSRASFNASTTTSTGKAMAALHASSHASVNASTASTSSSPSPNTHGQSGSKKHGPPSWVVTLRQDQAAMQSARQKAIMERRALNAERVVLVGELQQAVNAGDTSLVQSTITQLKTIETQLAQSIAQSSEAAKATVSANTAATGSNHSMALDAITTATMRWNNVAAALTKADQAMIALVNQLQAALPPPSSGTSTSGTSNSTH